MKDIGPKRLIISACCAVAIAIVAGISAYLLLSHLWWHSLWCSVRTAMVLGTILFLMDMVAAAVLVMRFKMLRPWVAVIALLVGFLGGTGFGFSRRTIVTCYIMMMDTRTKPSRHLLLRRQELLDEFRQKGVISDDTYARASSPNGRSPSASDPLSS